MITPSYSLTATERVLPRLALDFTTATLDPRVTFTRSGNIATVTNSSGVIVGINANLPRFDFDPVTLACRGLLIEESRTNVLLNSLIDGTNLVTQSVTVTAAARTLSFYGTGQIVLSGVASATVTGTGAYPTRTTLTFTPTAGTLTLTVTGTVQFAQLELGSFATSFIPTAASQVTRSADVATMTGTNFSDWFNAIEGAFSCKSVLRSGVVTGFPTVYAASDGTGTNFITSSFGAATPSLGFTVRTSNANVANMFQSIPALDGSTSSTNCGAYKLNSFATSSNATAPSTDTAGALPTVDRLSIGVNATLTGYFNGWVQEIQYWPQRLTNAEVQAFAK
jgi:hypothetical protein